MPVDRSQMTQDAQQGHADFAVRFPGLAGKPTDEIDRLVKELSSEVAQRMKGLAIAYMIIGGVAFFLCGGAYRVTSHYSFLAVAALVLIFVGLRVRNSWIAEVRLEFHRRYGPSPSAPNDGSAA